MRICVYALEGEETRGIEISDTTGDGRDGAPGPRTRRGDIGGWAVGCLREKPIPSGDWAIMVPNLERDGRGVGLSWDEPLGRCDSRTGIVDPVALMTG